MNYRDAFHKMAHSYPGGIEALAVRMDMKPAVLRNKANPNSTTNVLSADDLFLACSITGDHSPIHAFCAGLGLVCTKIDEQPSSDMSLFESMTGILCRFGDYSKQVHDSFADGRLEPHELQAIDRDMYSLIEAIMVFRARMGGMVEKPGVR